MTARASEAKDLLRAHVDVERSAQNQAPESMNCRADLTIRLHHMVEILSVVATRYCAASLALWACSRTSSTRHGSPRW